jgi:hypothetical protein
MKHIKHTDETTEILEIYTCNIRNIQMKHLEKISETHLKQNIAPPADMAYLVGNYGSQQAALGGAVEREDGGRRAARRGEERRAGAVAVDHAMSARRTRR